MAATRKTKYLCLMGPQSGKWLSVDEAMKQGYTNYNRAYSWGHKKCPSMVLIHEESLKVMAGTTW